jgi:outer membrane lipoprotein-sorting protein
LANFKQSTWWWNKDLYGALAELLVSLGKKDQSMLRKFHAVCISLIFTASLAVAADGDTSRTSLSAAQVVEKNVEARGGLQAWRAVQTMSLQGKLGAGGNQRATLPLAVPNQKSVDQIVPRRPVEEAQLPFLIELKRGRKMRFELQFNGKTAVQVYDGANGWKLRPFLNRMQVEPYTTEELKKASMQADIDGPLVDYAAKGGRVELDGTEKVEGRNTYKLKLTLKSGQTLHVWVDAENFLETKIEGQPRRLDGKEHPVQIYYRDYRKVDGLQIPFVLETKVLPVARTAVGLRDTPVPTEKIFIDKVAVNPNLDASLFSKLEVPTASKAK